MTKGDEMFSVFFSGTDVSGKNSVMHGLAKEFNYKPFMSPRSPICNMIYDEINKRNTECYQHNIRLIKNLLEQNTYFILIKAKPKILVKRALARDEKHVRTEKDFEYHQKIYDIAFKTFKQTFPIYSKKFIEIDNSGDLKQTVTKLKNKILKLEEKK